jgi:hypothetical protein
VREGCPPHVLGWCSLPRPAATRHETTQQVRAPSTEDRQDGSRDQIRADEPDAEERSKASNDPAPDLVRHQPLEHACRRARSDPITQAHEEEPSVCGRSGIRTHERVAPLAVFKTAAFVRSATLPAQCLMGAGGLGLPIPGRHSIVPRDHRTSSRAPRRGAFTSPKSSRSAVAQHRTNEMVSQWSVAPYGPSRAAGATGTLMRHEVASPP